MFWDKMTKWLVITVVLGALFGSTYYQGYQEGKSVYVAKCEYEATKAKEKDDEVHEEAMVESYYASDTLVNDYLDRVFGKEDRVRACKTMCPDSVQSEGRPCVGTDEKVDYVPFDYSKKEGVQKTLPIWETESDDVMGEYMEGKVPSWAEPKPKDELLDRAIKELL